MLKQRNVWTRIERIEKLLEQQKWAVGDPVLGIPKVRTSFKKAGKKKKDKKKEDDAK
jgi:small basic protein (TIGR04137 family)